ncbi:YbaB/EbfC family nucleoid-associated protein [Saccharomonospora viridis]|uniref:YbaB/EbfC family nucleoid-associated protein n=1 Tax=Saccharomonospora viridis TaxID=1852 RepID=UPI002409E87F|nr:YbaB/EbfC family nucleoid-associated protein [Saccharomonospora viridis]
MIEQVPVGGGSTKELIEQARTRRDALSSVDALMAKATGTAHDVDNTVEVTVDARGKLLRLWLAPAAVNWGPERLGSLIVEVAHVAMQEAVQASYNMVALQLGEDMTYLIERLSGMPAPARDPNADPGITVEEFQRRREERLREAERRAGGTAQPGRDGVTGGSRSRADDHGGYDDYDLDTFDPATLRSDR